MEPRWRWQPLGAPNPSARTSDLSAGWVQPYSWRSEGGETNLRDLRWHRAKGPAKVHWAGILWAYHVGRRLEPCEVWMSKALASSPWLVVLLYLESTGSTEPARDPKLPEAVGLRALARARRWQAPLGFLNENGHHGLQLSASFQVALAQNIAETGRLAAAIHLAKAAAAAEAEEGSIASLRRPLRQLCSTCFESRWRLGLGLLTDLRLLRLRGRPRVGGGGGCLFLLGPPPFSCLWPRLLAFLLPAEAKSCCPRAVCWTRTGERQEFFGALELVSGAYAFIFFRPSPCLGSSKAHGCDRR